MTRANAPRAGARQTAALATRARRWASVLLALLSFTAGASERITFAEVRSEALGRTLPIAVVRPEKPAIEREQAPVLFILHGRGRTHRSLLDAPAARAALLAAPFHIVLPQGEDGWYIDAPARPEDRYATYMEEVVAWVEENVSAARTPSKRGIAGWSMGGFGAVRFAQTHPDQFGFVASMIGLLDFPRPETLPEGQNYRVPVARFTSDPELWAKLNPLHAIDRLRRTTLTLVLATRGFERTMNENFLAVLEAQKIPAGVHWLEGGHEFSVVERAVPLVLADASAFFGREP